MHTVLADVISPQVHLHQLLAGWQTDWMSWVALFIELGIALWYVVSVIRLARRGRKWSHWRTASFLAGTLSVVIAVQSGLASYDDSVFQCHVVQHLLLMNVAPIFYALAAPITLALQASDRGSQQRLLKLLHGRVVGFITNPILVAVNFFGTMLIFFITPFYQFSLEHPLLHDLTHLHFLISGILYWSLVVGVDPSRWRLSFPEKLGYLVGGIPVTSILGLALTQSSTSIAPLFHTVGDTHAGGALLWIVGEVFTLTAIMIVFAQWMRTDGRESARSDRRLDAAVTTALLASGESGAPGGPLDGSAPVRRDTVIAVTFVGGRLVASDTEHDS